MILDHLEVISAKLDVKPYVIKFWISEFDTYFALQSEGIFTSRHLRKIMEIKYLLIDQNLSVTQAGKRLKENQLSLPQELIELEGELLKDLGLDPIDHNGPDLNNEAKSLHNVEQKDFEKRSIELTRAIKILNDLEEKVLNW